MEPVLTPRKRRTNVDVDKLAEFLTKKQRVDMSHDLRDQIADGLRNFEIQLESMRKQVEPMVVIPETYIRHPIAPHSTPIG